MTEDLDKTGQSTILQQILFKSQKNGMTADNLETIPESNQPQFVMLWRKHFPILLLLLVEPTNWRNSSTSIGLCNLNNSGELS